MTRTMEAAQPAPVADWPVVEPAEVLADPHGTYARWRPVTPVVNMPGIAHVVLRFQDVTRLMTDPRTRQVDGPVFVKHRGVPDGALARFLSGTMLLSNDAEHQRRRAPFARDFAQAALRALRPLVRQQAEALVRDLPRGVPFCFVERCATRLPSEIMAALLGVPQADAPWFSEQVRLMSPSLTAIFPKERIPEMEAAAAALTAYVQDLMAHAGAQDPDGLIARITEAGGDRIDAQELACQFVTLILAGSDTTRAGLSMTLALLLHDGAAWADLCGDEALLPGAVAEGLRYDPPVGSFPRLVVAPLEIGSATLPPLTMIGLSTLSAMRDPAQYAEPDRFDIRRADHPKLHPVFGGGPHRCLGEVLARIEMEEALRAVATLAPGLRLLDMPRMFGAGGIRAISPMPVLIPPR